VRGKENTKVDRAVKEPLAKSKALLLRIIKKQEGPLQRCPNEQGFRAPMKQPRRGEFMARSLVRLCRPASLQDGNFQRPCEALRSRLAKRGREGKANLRSLKKAW